MANILILYSSTDGQTGKICNRLKQVIGEENNRVTLIPVGEACNIDLQPFDKIVIGSSVRYGKHHPHIVRFIDRHATLLSSKANAFFSVNLVARKPEKNQAETNPYVLKFLRRISWRPRALAVFAGKLDYPRYRFLDRLIIRLIMRMTGGPNDPEAVVEFTDWQQVENFGRLIRDM